MTYIPWQQGSALLLQVLENLWQLLKCRFSKHCLLAYLYSVDHYICSYQVLLTYLKLLPVFFLLLPFWLSFLGVLLTDFIFLYFSKSCLVQLSYLITKLGKKIRLLKEHEIFSKNRNNFQMLHSRITTMTYQFSKKICKRYVRMYL